MSQVRVHNFSVSLDGFGTGEGQSLDAPFGHADGRLLEWFFATRTFHEMNGEPGGETGADEAFASNWGPGIGAEIMGRNKFGPQRGPWTDDGWRGWWGDDPVFHTPVFVLTHHPRPSIEMKGGTTFHFIEASPAEALEAVHTAGYIHRDVCPRNFVCSQDVTSLKLIDFGLTVPARKEFMQPGMRTGTPNYMAPEVVRRKQTDQRLDIFAYGVSMYELFAFDLPWQRGSDGRAAMAHGLSTPPPVSKFYPKIHPTLEAAIHKCMEANPDNRFSSITQFLKAISRLTHEDKPA